MSETSISPEYPFASHYVTVHGARMHYVDEGDGDPIVFLHGNPTWSYLWRNVIPHLRGVGRCIAPDLVGMGRSDKPDIGYRFVDHARYLDGFIRALDLKRITFVVHDWGSALGFDWATRHASDVRGLAFMEAILSPAESWAQFAPGIRELFQGFRTPGVGEKLVLDDDVFLEQLLPGGVARGLGPAEMAHYRAPFPDRASRKPVWVWPNEIPIEGRPADVVQIVTRYRDALCASPVPKLLFAVEPGALIPPPLVAWCREHMPALEVVDLGQGLHFVQEDHPHEIGRRLAEWIRRLPAGGPTAATATSKTT
jgi:haloalkane dehalogenase